MNRQGFDKNTSLVLVLLLLAIGALAFYLQPGSGSLEDGPETKVDNSEMSESLGSAKVSNRSPAATDSAAAVPGQGAVPDSASTQTSVSTQTSPPAIPPVSMDPDTARAAVHQVENSVYERATAMFEREAVDVQWAGPYEQALRDMFAQHQGLQRVSVNSISCHTSMCRIEVFTPRDSDADFFTAMFYSALANFRDGALSSDAAIARRMEQGITSVYVARAGHKLGFY